MRGMRGQFLAAGLLNVAALSALFISSIGWKCEKGYHEASLRYMTDAPLEWSQPINDEAKTNDESAYDDGDYEYYDSEGILPRETDEKTVEGDFTPSYLQWDATKPERPPNWSFETPRFCDDINDFDSSSRGEQKIIVHYHMQHNAGTDFFLFAKQFTPCATRACWQEAKHCLVSYNEEVEAENIRQNYEQHGVQYVSYEVQLPPRFPLPFVSETARRGLFFTTIVRDPFRRFLTYKRRTAKHKGNGYEPHFWMDFQGKQGPYAGDNLNARWLSGAQGSISADQVNIAKCRLQLFDLVIADKLYDFAVEKVMCPLNNWEGTKFCTGVVENKEHQSSKSNPLNSTDPLLIGAWVERLRPSFEIYDYARLLSWRQLKERGVEDLPELSSLPSYYETLAKYTKKDLENISDETLRKTPLVSLENEKHFHPPVEFCNHMKEIWTTNPDEIPDVFGIGAIKNGVIPKIPQKDKEV